MENKPIQYTLLTQNYYTLLNICCFGCSNNDSHFQHDVANQMTLHSISDTAQIIESHLSNMHARRPRSKEFAVSRRNSQCGHFRDFLALHICIGNLQGGDIASGPPSLVLYELYLIGHILSCICLVKFIRVLLWLFCNVCFEPVRVYFVLALYVSNANP